MSLRAVSLASVAALAFVIGTQSPVMQSIAQEKSAETKAEKKAEGRVPAYYAQVGLSKDQKDKIYSLQAKYTEQITALQKQIAELEAKQIGRAHV